MIMEPQTLGLVGTAVLFVLLAMGMHIGLALALVGFLGYGMVVGLESALPILGMTPYSSGSSFMLSVIPLFVLMGQFAFVSGISGEIFKAVHSWIGHTRGGLAMATILGCAGFSAISGSSLATAATMGTVAMPEMRKYGYDPSLASGSVAAGGTLGILIPPSIGFVIYGILIEESIGKLFMAGILPGIMLAGIFILTVYVQCLLRPALGPTRPKASMAERWRSLGGVWGMLVLFTVVIGGIYAGIFTPHRGRGGWGLRGVCYSTSAGQAQPGTHPGMPLGHRQNHGHDFFDHHRGRSVQPLSGRHPTAHAVGRFPGRAALFALYHPHRHPGAVSHTGMRDGLLRHHDPHHPHTVPRDSGPWIRSHLVPAS